MYSNETSFCSNSSKRDTLSLLWTCLSTVFLCVWTAIHPNTPPQNPHNHWSKRKWCLLTLLFPELVFQFILTEFASAKRLRDRQYKIKRDAGGDLPLNEMSHHEPCCNRKKISGGNSNSEKLGLKHTYLIVMGALQFRLGEQSPKYPTEEGFEILVQYDMLPSVTFLNERIERRQKSDYPTKAIVCVQVLWISIETIARQICGLPITPLEHVTLAQIWFAFCVYAVWATKPQGLEEPIIINLSSCSRCLQFLDKTEYFVEKRPEFNFVEDLTRYLLCFVADTFVSLIYVGIHAWGWNAPFPTYAELILWRVAVCVFCASLGTFGVWTLIEWVFEKGRHPEKNSMLVIVLIGLGCARVIFITEAFVSLRRLPPGSYITTSWSNILPHIG